MARELRVNTMPELPEVETIRQNLRRGGQDWPSLLNQQITGAQLLWKRTLTTPAPAEFLACIQGQNIKEIGRRGKYLIFHLSSKYLLIHLRMSGDLLVESQDEPIAPHNRLILFMNQGWRLAFNDARKFGRAWLVDDPLEVLAKLGPEPLDPDFTERDFSRNLRSRRRQLKPLLLDQGFLAGVGNIYADEALHMACLHPLAIACELSDTQAMLLYKSIRKVLREGIQANGASIDWVYRGGDFQNHFRVYQRAGQPCPRCGEAIQRIVIGQRGTHFCAKCQIK
jgi:formamidopyrimidine-DNA glycosylase